MTPEEHAAIYNQVKDALEGKMFVLIIPTIKDGKHVGNYMMSNISKDGVSKILIRLSGKFSPNMKVDHFLKTDEQ